MSVPGGFLFPNPFLTQGVFPNLPGGQRAAFSQDIGALLFFTSGQPLNTVFYPQFNPFSFNTSFQGLFDGPFQQPILFPGSGTNLFLGGR
ncbi:hypothetical protein [Vampirovibrio chlorellavorus]|uniref:hypothetical protein n=1 Tax=Vampirovibrio chlorellavorus TaxID=758823 RepID=UPI0026F01684|nr:hypothetical protein [Vampirovibrio chlorellavorus]